ncbi:hypothetical protein [Sulfurirhabdus autotrophica]|uniref:Uncharacterized protein n=1 Tax=Sulfurirhabdus autotrophica TaxID=1706046 RepID=A0A4R3XRW1_9PROT|nr:hypothetical protein [Sulfurirhabdus autotrophica]TCV81072.1 hypothetical protein EDC63_12730 [Sulfurirhabdus autotrophica]
MQNQPVNLTAHVEQLPTKILEELDNRAWADRNAEALSAHGVNIASTGLAGTEFDRI